MGALLRTFTEFAYAAITHTHTQTGRQTHTCMQMILRGFAASDVSYI